MGRGAVLDALLDAREVDAAASPEARMADRRLAAADLPADLLDCAGGRELVEAGFVADVEIAGAARHSEVVPVLVGESFRDAASLPPDGPRLRRVGS